MGRLFWKFFLFISLAQLAVLLGVGAAIWVEDLAVRRSSTPEINVHPRAAFLIESAADTLQYGGTNALTKLLAAPNEPVVYALDENNRDILGRSVPSALVDEAHRLIAEHADSQAVRRLESNDGHRYLVFAPMNRNEAGSRPQSGGNRRPWRIGLFRLPLAPMIATLLGSLLCAVLLARYLSNPIRSLRSAFESAAKGNLNVRIGPLMANRKDVLADLGRDFDRMAMQLQALMESQRRLLHDVSHELRSPLARLQIAVGLARQEPAAVQATMDRIERESTRIDDLVGELLTLAKLESGVFGALDEEIDLCELMEEIVADARFEATPNGRGIAFTRSGSVAIKGETELVHRAIENIVRNALKHTPSDAGINIDVARTTDGNGARITVTDAGQGVPEHELAAIFEPFYRGAGAANTNGHGLGLSIARQIVEAHGGAIRASNRPEGGLCIEIVLPISRSRR